MKYAVMILIAAVLGVASLYLVKGRARTEHEQWKYTFVEPETRERPASFEDMKFKPGSVELRAPASKDK